MKKLLYSILALTGIYLTYFGCTLIAYQINYTSQNPCYSEIQNSQKCVSERQNIMNRAESNAIFPTAIIWIALGAGIYKLKLRKGSI